MGGKLTRHVSELPNGDFPAGALGVRAPPLPPPLPPPFPVPRPPVAFAVRTIDDSDRSDSVAGSAREGRSELHQAVFNNDVASLRALLANGAQRGVKNSVGATALWYAAVRGPAAALRLLLPHGRKDDEAAWRHLARSHDSAVTPLVALSRLVKCRVEQWSPHVNQRR